MLPAAPVAPGGSAGSARGPPAQSGLAGLGGQAGLAQRILLALSESEFAATIGELKRQMDRQSQLFLQQIEEQEGARLGAMDPARRTADARPAQHPPAEQADQAGHGGLADLSGGDGVRAAGRRARWLHISSAASPPHKRAVDDIGDVGFGGGDDAARPAVLRVLSGPDISSSRPLTPPGTPPGPAAAGAAAVTGRGATDIRDSSPPPPCPAPGPGVARSATVTLSSSGPRRGEPAAPPAPPCGARTLGRGRPALARPQQAPPVRGVPFRPPPGPPARTAPRQAGRPALAPPQPGVARRPTSARRGAPGSRPGSRSLASRASGGASVRVPSQATFVKQPQLRRPLQLMQLPVKALVSVFSFLGGRERTLPVCRRWVDLGLRSELWTSIAFDGRGARSVLCRRLDFTRALRRLHIADRHDVNHILDTALRVCPHLSHLRLERCRGPGPIAHCGTYTPRSVVILDTPVCGQLVDLLANITPTMDECTVTVNVEQAAAIFGSLLKMALVADGEVPEQLQTLWISLGAAPAAGASGAAAAGRPGADVVGTLRWRRHGRSGTLTYNRVGLAAEFAVVNQSQ